MTSPSPSLDPCSVQGLLTSSVVAFKGKSSPKKCDPASNSKSQADLVANNNEEEIVQQRSNYVRLQHYRELAAMLLQRQVQVWLLRRQEAQSVQEVQKLRGDLRKAAIRVIEDSYARSVKRRVIGKCLHELGSFETRLDTLLQRCITRKRQLAEIQRFITLRRQQKHQKEDRKRILVHNWLRLCIRSHRKKNKQRTDRAHEKLVGWVRRWKLRKRCEARAAACGREHQFEAQRHSSVLRIVAVYRVYKLRQKAKRIVQYRRCMRDGLTKLYSTIHLIVLRTASFRWYSRIQDLKTAHEAATVIQRVYQGHHTRLWFRGVIIKLRERFRCANCGALEPGGRYCKYCGRHRPSYGSLSNVLMLHEKWQLRKISRVGPKLVNDQLVPTIPSSKMPTHVRSRCKSLRLLASGSVDPIASLPEVLSHRHRRLVSRNSDLLAPINSPTNANIRRNSVPSISEQTALRAMAIADLQAKYTTTTHVNVLEMHFGRLHRANAAINR